MHKSRHLTIVGPPFYYHRFLSFSSFFFSFFSPSSLFYPTPYTILRGVCVCARAFHQAFPTLRPLRCYRVSYDFHRRLCAAGVGPWRKDEKKKKKKKGWFGIDSLRLFVLTACPGSRLRFNRLGIIMARVARVLAWNICFCRSTDVFVAALEHARTKSLVPLNISWVFSLASDVLSSPIRPSSSSSLLWNTVRKNYFIDDVQIAVSYVCMGIDGISGGRK